MGFGKALRRQRSQSPARRRGTHEVGAAKRAPNCTRGGARGDLEKSAAQRSGVPESKAYKRTHVCHNAQPRATANRLREGGQALPDPCSLHNPWHKRVPCFFIAQEGSWKKARSWRTPR